MSFGIDVKDQDNGRAKIQLSLQVSCKQDHQNMERLRLELAGMVAKEWKTWFPDNPVPSNEVLLSFCNTFVSARKKKKNSEDTWPGITKASIDADDCTHGRCKIVDKETGTLIPYSQLPGRVWHKAVFELKYVFIQATKAYGVTKKLRYILTSPKDEVEDFEPL